jgi:hypothetical protein
MLYSVPPLRIARLLLELRPERTLHLPPEQRGNVLRGAFGTIFQRQVCGANCPGAATCPRRDECAYAQLFEPRCPAGAGFGAETAPRGFLFRPPLSQDPEFGANRPLRFELRLFGKAMGWAEHFLRTFQLFARYGLADRAVHLQSVHTLDWQGTSQGALVKEGRITGLTPFPLTFEPFTSTCNSGEFAKIEFLTPTWLREGGRDLRVPTVSGLAQRARDRISMLCRVYADREWQANFGGIGRAACQSTILDWDGSWVQPGRTSTRTGEIMPMGGFVGVVRCAKIEPALWPLLFMGQELHVGRHAVWGHGWYCVEASNAEGKMS